MMKKVFFLVLVLLSIILILNNEKNTSIENYLKNTSIKYKDNYENIYNDHKILSDAIFQTMINNKAVIEILKNAKYNKKLAQKKLYKQLYNTYELLKKHNLKQLYFFLGNNECFLKFNDTKYFTNKLSLSCLDKESNSYGFSYPIFYKNKYIANVKILLDNKIIAQEFFKRYKLDSAFLQDNTLTNEIKTSLEKDSAVSLYDENINKVKTFIKIENPLTKVIDIFLIYSDTDYILAQKRSYYIYLLMLLFSSFYIFYLYFYKSNTKKKMNLVYDKLEENENYLAQKSKMAAMGEMMDSVAHQWIQPISIIRMRIQMMEMKFTSGRLDAKEMEDNTNGLMTQIDHLLSTLSEFRMFFRPSTKIEEISAYSLVQNSLYLIEDEMKKNLINTNLLGDETLLIKVNANEFKHVIINIVNNAKDAFRENNIKKKELRIYIEKLEEKVLIKLCDNAGGIPEHILAKVFDPYFTTKEKSNGSGIGLYMTKQIIEKYNGEILAKRQDEGTCFSIII